MPLDEQLHLVSVDATDPARPKVTLDDDDISRDIDAVSLRVQRGQLPEVILELAPTAGVKYDGMARVVVGIPMDMGPAAETFLSAIDPEELQRTALDRPDLDVSPTSTTEAILRQLRAWARGES